MTVTALLDYIAALKAIPPHLAARRRDELLGALGLAGAAQLRLGRLSQGQRQLVGAAQALLGDPEVLLLDEPFEGLDHDSRHRLLAWLHRPGRVTLLATHRDQLAIPGTVAIWHLRAGKLLVETVNDGHPQFVQA